MGRDRRLTSARGGPIRRPATRGLVVRVPPRDRRGVRPRSAGRELALERRHGAPGPPARPAGRRVDRQRRATAGPRRRPRLRPDGLPADEHHAGAPPRLPPDPGRPDLPDGLRPAAEPGGGPERPALHPCPDAAGGRRGPVPVRTVLERPRDRRRRIRRRLSEARPPTRIDQALGSPEKDQRIEIDAWMARGPHDHDLERVRRTRRPVRGEDDRPRLRG